MFSHCTAGSLWKDPTSGTETENPQHSESTHFPLLYHLLLLRNYYHNSQHFYRTESYPSDQPQPLDLSVKAKEEYLSAFTKERKKISCDESIKDIEEVEVVYKEDKVKPESVKEFVERKIKEYKKAEENFESFVNKPNLKENDIKRKMKKIKTKYTKINKKLKKLNELKPKLVRDKTFEDEQIASPSESHERDTPPVEDANCSHDHHNKEQNNNVVNDLDADMRSCDNGQPQQESEDEEKLLLKSEAMVDGARVSTVSDSSTFSPKLFDIDS